jgi:hypothetical protein
MLDQRALIARLEAADTGELIQLVTRPDIEAEKVLRTYLGNACYQRLHSLALRQEMMRNARGPRVGANVVVIPGTLGSELSMTGKDDVVERLWLSPRRIVAGQLQRLTLNVKGLSEQDENFSIHASGIMKRYYGELLLTLAENWNVHAFWYDWRKDMRIAAAQLQASINNWFPEDEPVHIVAHAAGGLVARAYIAQYPESWERGGRLVMLGTPNHGVFTAVQGFTGQLLTIRNVDMLDAWHDNQNCRTIVHSFPHLYQLLPSPLELPELEALYDASTYAPDLTVSQLHLENARRFHQLLSGVVDPERMIYFAGDNRPTYAGIRLEKLELREPQHLQEVFPMSLEGDGTVPHRLGLLKTDSGQPIPTFFVEASHGELLVHPSVINALHELLTTERTQADEYRAIGKRHNLRMQQPTEGRRKRAAGALSVQEVRQSLEKTWNGYQEQLDTLMRRVSIRSGEPVERSYIAAEERAIEEILSSGFLTGLPQRQRTGAPAPPFDPPEIQINVVHHDITDLDAFPLVGTPIDAIAVGHYSGGKPEGAMKALDIRISAAIDGREPSLDGAGEPAESDLLLTQYSQRGTIGGELAQLFLLDDPRPMGDATDRVIVIAGMGVPGRFGVPELTVLARELCWTLGRMGRRHLATLLIGVGRDNLSMSDAVSAWVRGIKYALTGVETDAEKRGRRMLQQITFVEIDPRRMIEIDKALRNEAQKLGNKNRMVIHHAPLNQTEQDALQQAAREYLTKIWAQPATSNQEASPTRVTVGLDGQTYRFGAITSTASIPERAVSLDPALVMSANDELAAEGDADRQLQLGQFMERLLLPDDLRPEFATDAPLVMMMDSTTARIHWELLAQLDPVQSDGDAVADHDRKYSFWGTSRGFTRQLRTVFAPPPEPPPPAQRMLRVLVVADPAADDPLPGAEEEGIAVADLFERFNTVHAASKNRIEVVRLFGPREATRTEVLRHLMMRTYNLVHFAGHCMYDAKTPGASGWIFSGRQRLSANELRRIDRIPKFVFSNACESGITPDRSEKRSVELAPSFAEAFFERGVSNFVCTAWPVDDRAARDFALTLYAGMLGLASSAGAKEGGLLDSALYGPGELKPMYKAMRDARCAIADAPNDVRTWGAYQHYGNPYFQLFDPATMKESRK